MSILLPLLQYIYEAQTNNYRVEDKTVRYVAEENIELLKQMVPYSLMPLAGRYFKRWDKVANCFVSNIKDEYPDD